MLIDFRIDFILKAIHNLCCSDNRSKTCPQCRQCCESCQINRIYIEFACDEDLACAQTLKKSETAAINSDAEETIKLLLEHIETGPPESAQKCDIECDNCKDVLQAFDCAHADMNKMAEDLGEKEKENATLKANNENAVKRIDELEMQNRAHEHNLRELNERFDTSERIIATFQSDNIFKDEQINNLNDVLQLRNRAVQELINQLNVMKIEHQNVINRICETHKIDFTHKILRKFVDQKSMQNSLPKDRNNCQALIPYTGNIAEWDYMMIPVLKNPNKNMN